MARRRVWWTGIFLLAVVLGVGAGWRLSREVPEGIRRAEEALRDDALRKGVRIAYRNLKLHLFYLSISLDNLRVEDALSGLTVGEAERVDLSLSPLRILSGQSPVSRIRARNFSVSVSGANLPLFEKLRETRAGEKERTGTLPDILLLGGTVRIGSLGPVRRWEARIPELRIRDVRFLGTRLSFSAEKAAGTLDVPGIGEGAWPFGGLEGDAFIDGSVVRLRRFRASGPSASVRASGTVDVRRGNVDLRISGDADLQRFPAAWGGDFGRRAGEVVLGGKLQYSADVEGSAPDVSGSARLLFEDVLFSGGSRGNAEASLSAEKGKVRLDSLRAAVLGGSVSGKGEYELATGRGSGTISVKRASLRGTPWWGRLGISWAPAGPLDAAVEFSGSPSRLLATLSLDVPDGVERFPAAGGEPGRIPGPFSLSGSALLAERRNVEIQRARIRVGLADVTGSGNISIPDRSFAMRGDVAAGPGRAADLGIARPLRWERVAGTWEADGKIADPRVAARLEATDMSWGGTPPMTAVARIEGEALKMLHGVVDVTGALASVTASGTLASPLAGGPFAAEGTAAVRNLDLGELPRWTSAILASIGEDPAPAAKALSGAAGRGSANVQYSVSGGRMALSGTVRLPEGTIRGWACRSIVVDGSWEGTGRDGRWNARLDGEIEGGGVRLSGDGTNDGFRSIEGSAERIDVGRVIPILGGKTPLPIRGVARVDFSAVSEAGGWEVRRFLATSPRLFFGESAIDEVRAEGTLDGAKGRFAATAARPGLSLSGTVRRGGDWPAAFRLAAADVPSSLMLGLFDSRGAAASGSWTGEAEGTVHLGAIARPGGIPADAVPDLKFSLKTDGVEISGARFESCRVDGRREGNGLSGTILTAGPDTRLSFGIALRDPYLFRLEGGFSVGSGAIDNSGKLPSAGRRFLVTGRIAAHGALRAVEKSTGRLDVARLVYREGDIELSGKDLSAVLEPEGIRLAGGTLQVAGNPVRFGGKATWKGDLDLRIDGRLPAGAVRIVVPEIFDRLDGTVAIDLRIVGFWKDPSLMGTARLEKGLLSFRNYAQVFEEMTAEAAISRDKIVFERFEGRSGGGYLDGWGEVPLRFDERQRLFFSVDFLEMRFPYPDDLRPVVHGHVELTGPVDDLLATGEVTVESALYTKRSGLDTLVPDFRKRLADVTARKEKAFRVRLDIDGIADGTIRVRNNVVDAKAKGEFKVAGDTNRVIVLGSFDVVEGTVDYRGNRFDIKRLAVDFQDPRRNNPRLDIRAETKKGNTTVLVAVTGTLEKYEVDLSSDPPLSKNDIVSLLSFGVTTEALAGAEGSVGAGTAATIALGGYKGNVEEGVRGVVGLDRFAIEPAFSATTKTFEPKFIVGKSIGDKLSVTMSTTVGTKSESSAAAELKLIENIYLQGGWESTTTTKEGDLGADLKFRYRYRTLKDLLRGRD